MARENQGLQIALIVFVMLTILLGATTYWFFKNEEDALTKATQYQTEAGQQKKNAETKDEENTDLRNKIGVGKSEDISAIFIEDMKKHGGAYAEEERLYRKLLEKLSLALEEKNAELAKANESIQSWKDKYTTREQSKQPQLDEFEKRAAKVAEELKSEQTKFATERKRYTEDTAGMQASLDAARTDSKNAIAKVEGKLKDRQSDFDKLQGQYKIKADALNSVTAATFDAPEGEVRWVNQRNGAVWINLGRADGLARQISFAVYPSDITNYTTSSKKASIEVIQILGDHLAEARVTDDSPNNPIMPGDKLNTPLWNPGDRKHFALTGFIDIDGDNVSDLQTVIDLVTMNGGVVDCYLNDKGEVVGEMTPRTRFLVRGFSPDEKGVPALLKGDTDMQNIAERLGIQKMLLPDLLEQAGWKSGSHVVRYDHANPKDFPYKLPEGAQKTAPGNVFVPRDPPKKAPNSAY
jgi:hypothetical protein